MNLTLFHGYPDRIGKRAAWVGTGNGPASYVGGNAATDPLVINQFQFYIDSVTEGSISVSGTYYVVAQPSVAGVRTAWTLRYFTTATGAEVTNTTNLSAEKFVLSGFGGFS
ncbi:MAG TPA: hypothetical protein VER98_03985 [Terriglobia bacterium]|nr:hypothetical protein [Terriglobia bacterium]